MDAEVESLSDPGWAAKLESPAGQLEVVGWLAGVAEARLPPLQMQTYLRFTFNTSDEFLTAPF